MSTVTDYFDKRMQELSISDSVNTHFILTESTSNPGKFHKKDAKFFEADAEGNIVINYYNLSGKSYTWKKEDTKWPRPFVRIRLRTAGVYRGQKLTNENQKYFQEKGSGQFPFFTPRILAKYKACKEAVLPDGTAPQAIDTLVVVEGEIKAFKGDMAGLDIIGIPSIHGFYNGDVRGKLHDDIQELIVTCQVKKIIFLVDADLLTLKWEANKDLARRAESFFSSVKLFRESLQLLIDDDTKALELIAFSHLRTKFNNEAKGLDDLLVKYSSVTNEIIADLMAFQFAQKFFSGRLINDTNKDLAALRKYLGLHDEQEFYKCYGDFIGSREFLFRNKRYEYNAEKKEVQFVRHEDADKYMRIGPDWVKVIAKLNKYGEKEEEIVTWKISEIQRDYKKYPDFLEQIMKYDDFCNEPAWNGNYQRVIQGCYNLCEPLRWDAKEGSIASTIKFLKHIFQGSGMVQLDSEGRFEKEYAITGDQFTVALDYFTIMLRHPKNMLPVPILVSPENGTGKSTVLKWMQLIFGSNMVILGNDQFKMKFNGHYITKFVIAIDEGFLEVDKKSEKERLKQLVTADSVYLENKGQNVRKINYYGKLIICSNDADRVMKIDEGESRWFVVRVPVIPVADRDPDLELKLKAEVEAFLHFLKHRTIHHPRTDRLWFKPEWFITEQFKIIVDQTKNRVDRVFEDWITEQFRKYRLPIIKYSLGYLVQLLNDQNTNKYKVDRIDLRNYLNKRNIESEKRTQRFRSPANIDISDNDTHPRGIIWKDNDPTFPYVFKIEDWLPEREVELLMPLSDPETGKMYPPKEPESIKIDGSQEDLPF